MRSRLLLLTLAGFAAWLTIAVITWSGGAPLGHDESQYAIAARETLAGVPARWFYLSRGMNVVAAPGIWLGASERALRLVPLLLGGIGFAAATWTLARRALSSAGAMAAASAGVTLLVLASARNVVRYATDLLSDFPAAACLLAALALIVDEVDREDGPRWRLVAAAPLFAAAMYVRYGSVVPIAVIVTCAVIVGARTLARRPLPVIVTAGVFLALLVPHLIEAQHTTGSPFGILLASREVPQEQYAGEGLVTYVASNPFKLYGMLIPIPLVAGLESIVSALRARDRRRLLAWLVAVGSLVAIGLTTHAQVRYALVSIAILTALGVDQIRAWLSRLPAPRARIGYGIAIGAVVLVWGSVARRDLATDAYRSGRMKGTLTAAAAIRADAHGAPCMVIGYHYTQLEWYSGCPAPLVMSAGSVSGAHVRGERVYVVRDFMPTWTAAPQPAAAEFPGVPTIVVSTPNVVEVTRLQPPP